MSLNSGGDGTFMTHISVIVPVHNAEAFLSDSLDSLRKQTLADFEVICVDDGSTDSTPGILRKYVDLDDRFSLITKPNSGAADSRNAGLAKAKGKYVYFFDAEDVLYPDAFEKAVASADDFDAEIVIFKYRLLDSNSGSVSKGLRPNDLPTMNLDRETDKRFEAKLFQLTGPAPWTKLFLREFVEKNGLRFQNLPRVNDLYFSWTALASANLIAVLNEGLIKYRISQSGNLRSGITNTPLTIIDALRATYEFLVERNIYSNELEQSFLNESVAHFSYNLAALKTESAYQQLFEAGRNDLFVEFKLFDFQPAYFHDSATALFAEQLRNFDNYKDFLHARSKNIQNDVTKLSQELANERLELDWLDTNWEKLRRSPGHLFDDGFAGLVRKVSTHFEDLRRRFVN